MSGEAEDGDAAGGEADMAAIVAGLAAPGGWVRRPYRPTGDDAGAPSPAGCLSACERYCRAVPPPPGAICASVGATAVAFQKIVPATPLAKLRLPLVWKVTGVAVT